MKNLLFLLFIQVSTNGYLFSKGTETPTPIRQKININREWKFKLGDYSEAQKAGYDDKSWNNINLPHNFSIPYFQTAQWYTGYGWYRKYFDIPAQWKGKRVFIEFEAAFREAQIFVNGIEVGKHQGGYTGFSFDITNNIKPGRNVLAVRLNNNYSRSITPRNGDHNFTGGIYRDVYLVVTDPVHVTWYGTYVTTPKVSNSTGNVHIKTEIRNDGTETKVYQMITNIIDPAGKIVSSIFSSELISAKSIVTFDQTTKLIKNLKLWHPDHPNLYKVVSRIMDKKKVLDLYETTFGFRWVKWTADSGFFLNGKHLYFKGANVHQDHAGWASAVTNAAIKRDVQMVKDCGMDFIRGSHYPHDPAFSEACDVLGVLLWEENDFWGSGGTQRETDNWYEGGGSYPANAEDQAPFEESVKSDLREMIRIHRNHPSIIVWSMCNEPFFTSRGTITKVREFLKELTKLTHELDPSRMVGIGGSQRGEIDKLGDIAGYNGDGSRLYLNPGIPSVVTEYGSTIADRPGKYDPGWGDLQKEKFAWRSGEALWCAFDYGTRAGDFGKMGMIDYFRMPKNMYYWYRNEYRKIRPPKAVIAGIPAKIILTSNKSTIMGTDGTDDVQLIATVADKYGKPISNSPDVTLKIISGPGEFPTGSNITFSKSDDIYIRNGKAAIEFRSYYGGKTSIQGSSPGLKSGIITIETKGAPVYKSGITPKTEERPYVRYNLKKVLPAGSDDINIAYQKPTHASSELDGRSANMANDRDTISRWQAKTAERVKWWQVDLENLYTVSEIRLKFPRANANTLKIELSKDNQIWTPIINPIIIGNDETKLLRTINSSITGRFLKITFTDSNAKSVSLTEVEIFGKPVN